MTEDQRKRLAGIDIEEVLNEVILFGGEGQQSLTEAHEALVEKVIAEYPPEAPVPELLVMVKIYGRWQVVMQGEEEEVRTFAFTLAEATTDMTHVEDIRVLYVDAQMYEV